MAARDSQRRIEPDEGGAVIAGQLIGSRELPKRILLPNSVLDRIVYPARGVESTHRRRRIPLPYIHHRFVGETVRFDASISHLTSCRAHRSMPPAPAAQVAQVPVC